MQFYAVMRSDIAYTNRNEFVTLCASREEAIRIMNHMSASDEDENVFDKGYFIKSVPVDINKMVALGIISL